jgi:hypothetical protein
MASYIISSVASLFSSLSLILLILLFLVFKKPSPMCPIYDYCCYY